MQAPELLSGKEFNCIECIDTPAIFVGAVARASKNLKK
jgi:hypothetical protein